MSPEEDKGMQECGRVDGWNPVKTICTRNEKPRLGCFLALQSEAMPHHHQDPGSSLGCCL